jgi:hypothetical protein
VPEAFNPGPVTNGCTQNLQQASDALYMPTFERDLPLAEAADAGTSQLRVAGTELAAHQGDIVAEPWPLETLADVSVLDASVARCGRPAGGRMVLPGGERPRLPHARGSFVH